MTTYEMQAREIKAARICDVLRRADITSEVMESASEQDWELAAQVAQTRLPSAATRELVIRMLKMREPKETDAKSAIDNS